MGTAHPTDWIPAPRIHEDGLRGNDKDGVPGFAALYPPYNDTYVVMGRAEG